MKHIGNLQYAPGAKKKNKRIGRGPGSGHGGTSTKGNNGAQSRRGYKSKMAFEGGQMPLSRRIPKFGFFNPFRVEYQILNVGRLQEIAEYYTLDDNSLNPEKLFNYGILSSKRLPLKILGDGELSVALTVEAHSFSASARQKIETAGGTVIIHE
jgi:large subunit ribosomal protein L15